MEPADRDWVVAVLVSRWTSTEIVTMGRRCDAAALDALVALDDASNRVGLLTYRLDAAGLEVVTIDALVPRAGVGTALLETAVEIAREAAMPKLWLVTTSDNSSAIAFYRTRGLRLVAVHEGAVDRARAMKPSIPLVGQGGVELHDEVEFELLLAPATAR